MLVIQQASAIFQMLTSNVLWCEFCQSAEGLLGSTPNTGLIMVDKKKSSEPSPNSAERQTKSPEARILESPDGTVTPTKSDEKRQPNVQVETVETITLARGSTGIKQIMPSQRTPVQEADKPITAIDPNKGSADEDTSTRET